MRKRKVCPQAKGYKHARASVCLPHMLIFDGDNRVLSVQGITNYLIHASVSMLSPQPSPLPLQPDSFNNQHYPDLKCQQAISTLSKFSRSNRSYTEAQSTSTSDSIECDRHLCYLNCIGNRNTKN